MCDTTNMKESDGIGINQGHHLLILLYLSAVCEPTHEHTHIRTHAEWSVTALMAGTTPWHMTRVW